MGIIEEIQDYFLKGIYTFEINNKKAFIVVQTYRAQGKISLFFFIYISLFHPLNKFMILSWKQFLTGLLLILGTSLNSLMSYCRAKLVDSRKI